MSYANHKHEKIESEILNNLNYALKNTVNNKLLRMACFTHVKLLDDFSKIIVSVDYYDSNKVDDVVNELNIAKGIFRDQIAHNMSIRRVPEIFFEKDLTIQNLIKIDEILNDISKNDNK